MLVSFFVGAKRGKSEEEMGTGKSREK